MYEINSINLQKWNDLSKTRSFVEKHIGEETSRKSSVIMTMNQKVYLLVVSFSGIHNKFDTSIKHKGTLIIRNNNMDSEPLVIRVFHGEGLLLFVMVKRVVVWNPYLGQVKWIQARDSCSQDTFGMNGQIPKPQNLELTF